MDARTRGAAVLRARKAVVAILRRAADTAAILAGVGGGAGVGVVAECVASRRVDADALFAEVSRAGVVVLTCERRTIACGAGIWDDTGVAGAERVASDITTKRVRNHIAADVVELDIGRYCSVGRRRVTVVDHICVDGGGILR